MDDNELEPGEVPRYLARPIPERIGLVKLDKFKKVQLETIVKLMQQRVLSPQIREVLAEQLATGKMTRYRAGEWITFLHAQPWNVDRSGGKDR